MTDDRGQEVDHLFVGGHLIDPAQNISGRRALAIKSGKIAFIEDEGKSIEAREVHDITGKILIPGLIDLHTHVYWGGCGLGIDPDKVAAKTGVTTYVDTGSAGAGNWPGFYEHVIRKSKVRIYGFLNISVAGLAIYSDWIPRWEKTPLHHMSVPAAVEMAERYPDHIIGFKALCSGQYSSSGVTPARLAVEAGRLVQKPAMIHFDFPPPGVSEILDALRPGDVLTHAFRGGPNRLLTMEGDVERHAIRARERGVLFDIGHGVGSFSFDVARRMVEKGFLPDTISSDVHTGCIDGPAYDLPTTMSKMLCLGMSLEEVVACATIKPATVIGKADDLGHLKNGSAADITVLEVEEGEFPYFDGVRKTYAGAGVQSEAFHGKYRLKVHMTMIDGEVVE